MQLDLSPNINSDDSINTSTQTITFDSERGPHTIEVTGPEVLQEQYFEEAVVGYNRQEMAALTETLLGRVMNSRLFLARCITTSISQLDQAQEIIDVLRPMMVADKFAVYHQLKDIKQTIVK